MLGKGKGDRERKLLPPPPPPRLPWLRVLLQKAA
jgi:hypothetical protein